jgi:alpha-1,2-mannosyltransferase
VLAALLLCGALSWHIWATVDQSGFRWVLTDMLVFRDAVIAASTGGSLYDGGFSPSNLPFLYPPFAVLTLVPLAAVPLEVAKLGMTAASIAALLYLCHASWRLTRIGAQWRTAAALASAAGLLVSEPVQQVLQNGQVDLILAALVLADFSLDDDSRWKGVLAGVATAVKLTPALVPLFYLASRRRRAAGTAGVTFAACTAAAAVVFPAQSWQYWTHAVFRERIDPSSLGNQSLNGALLRAAQYAGIPSGWASACWLLLAVAVGAVGTRAVGQAARRLDVLGSYSAMTILTLLLSPLSWTPHWAALVPGVVWTVSRFRTCAKRVAASIVVGLALFAWPVHGIWSGALWTVYVAGFTGPTSPSWHSPVYLIVGDLYLVLGIALTAALTRASRCVSAHGGSASAPPHNTTATNAPTCVTHEQAELAR